MKQILCFANEPWGSSPGRTQQLLSRIPDAEILYLNPAGRSGPVPEKRMPGGLRIRVETLPVALPEEEGSLRFSWTLRRLCRFVEQVSSRFRSPLLWTTCPTQVHLLDRFDYSGLVYDCDRHWDLLPQLWEDSLAAAADLVITASPELKEQLQPCNSNVVLLRNGVDYAMYYHAREHPNPMPPLNGPVFAWAGTVSPALDLSPLLYTARSRPRWNFILFGHVGQNRALSALRQLRNVHFSGPLPPEETAAWLCHCDVLLDFLREDAFAAVMSSQMYGYFSTGRPIVAMQWPDQIEEYPDVVYAAHSREEFLTLCHHALDEVPGFASGRRFIYGEQADWIHRADAVARMLSSGLLL